MKAPVSYRFAKLLIQRSPVLPVFEQNYRTDMGPQILAWTQEEATLEEVYSELLIRTQGMAAWTLEPKKVPAPVHQAILAAHAGKRALQAIDTQRFNDTEGGVPPVSILYETDRLDVVNFTA